MAYYGRDPITMKKENEQWNRLLEKQRKRRHEKKIRAGPATDVYRVPKPLGGQPGRAFKPGEFEETMKDWQHFYNKKNLASDPLSLGKSAPEESNENQSKIGTRSKKLRKSKFPVTYSLKSDPKLLENRKKQEALDAKAKPITNMRDYKTTLKLKNENYFKGGKTKKRRRKNKRKTRRRKKKTKRKRKYRKKRTRRKKAGNSKLNSKQTFLKGAKKNEKQLKTMFKEYMNRFFITKKAITFDMVLEKIKNMKDSEFEKKINYINAVMNSSKSRSKKGGYPPDFQFEEVADMQTIRFHTCGLFTCIIALMTSFFYPRGFLNFPFNFILTPLLFCFVWVGFTEETQPAIEHTFEHMNELFYGIDNFEDQMNINRQNVMDFLRDAANMNDFYRRIVYRILESARVTPIGSFGNEGKFNDESKQ